MTISPSDALGGTRTDTTDAAGALDVATEAAKLALKMGSSASDLASFPTDLGEEFPWAGAMLKTLAVIRTKEEVANTSGGAGLEATTTTMALLQRCTAMVASAIVERTRAPTELDVTPLVECLAEVDNLMGHCRGRRRAMATGIRKRIRFEDNNKGDERIAANLHTRMADLARKMGLVNIVEVERKVRNSDIKTLSYIGALRKRFSVQDVI